MSVFTPATPRCAVRVAEGFCPGRTRAQVARGRVAAAKLAKATDDLTESLAEVVCVFQEHFGDKIEAAVVLEVPGETRRARQTTMRYRRDNIYVEYRADDHLSSALIIDASREVRMAATTRLSALYVACGGVLPKGI